MTEYDDIQSINKLEKRTLVRHNFAFQPSPCKSGVTTLANEETTQIMSVKSSMRCHSFALLKPKSDGRLSDLPRSVLYAPQTPIKNSTALLRHLLLRIGGWSPSGRKKRIPTSRNHHTCGLQGRFC